MRKWIDLLESFQTSEYGYWIMPDGTVIPCINADHSELAANQLGIDIDEDDEEAAREAVDDALDEGSIRVVAAKGSQEFNAEWSDTAITDDGKKALLGLLKLYSNREYFIMQNEYFEIYQQAVRYVRGPYQLQEKEFGSGSLSSVTSNMEMISFKVFAKAEDVEAVEAILTNYPNVNYTLRGPETTFAKHTFLCQATRQDALQVDRAIKMARIPSAVTRID